jgi:hypothetical protein
MKKIILLSLLSIVMISCKSQLGVSNGAYSDISLNRDSKDYSIKRLKEINTESQAIFGIPTDKSLSKKQGLVVRFNGINLMSAKRFLPIVTMVVLTATTGFAIQSFVGNKKEDTGWGSYDTGEPKMSLALASLLAIPISGALNNQLWNGSLNRAAWHANSELLRDNDDVDVFLNPKYDVETNYGIWTQSTKLKVRTMGARIKCDN